MRIVINYDADGDKLDVTVDKEASQKLGVSALVLSRVADAVNQESVHRFVSKIGSASLRFKVTEA